MVWSGIGSAGNMNMTSRGKVPMCGTPIYLYDFVFPEYSIKEKILYIYKKGAYR